VVPADLEADFARPQGLGTLMIASEAEAGSSAAASLLGGAQLRQLVRLHDRRAQTHTLSLCLSDDEECRKEANAICNGWSASTTVDQICTNFHEPVLSVSNSQGPLETCSSWAACAAAGA